MANLEKLLKNFIGIFIRFTGLYHLINWFIREKTIILLYHNPKLDILEKHLQYLKKHFNFITLDTLIHSIYDKNRSVIPQNPLIITIDDGFKGNFKLLHLFKKYENATVEVAPHYMFLNSLDAEKLGVLGSVYPPLKSEQKRLTLWNSLERVDCIASDHAPHTVEDKEDGAHGFPGLETSVALYLDAHNKKLLDIHWVIQRMSENPAKIFNLKEKGKIQEGYEGSLTLIDLKKEWTVKGNDQFTKCKWSPFEGKKLKGKVQSVIYKGELIFEEGEFY